ncbi:MAG: cytochrome c3 family protein, partial [Acidobacteriota bacterium]
MKRATLPAALSIGMFIGMLAGPAVPGALPAQSVGGGDPHLDRSLVPRPCGTCHEGHGASRSPMLPMPQQELCLSCHGSSSGVSQAITRGRLSSGARPQLLASVLAQTSAHPMTPDAYSANEPGAVTCSS